MRNQKEEARKTEDRKPEKAGTRLAHNNFLTKRRSNTTEAIKKRKMRENRILEGRCIDCGKNAMEDSVYCGACDEKKDERFAVLAERKSKGCLSCGTTEGRGGYRRCPKCRKKHRDSILGDNMRDAKGRFCSSTTLFRVGDRVRRIKAADGAVPVGTEGVIASGGMDSHIVMWDGYRQDVNYASSLQLVKRASVVKENLTTELIPTITPSDRDIVEACFEDWEPELLELNEVKAAFARLVDGVNPTAEYKLAIANRTIGQQIDKIQSQEREIKELKRQIEVKRDHLVLTLGLLREGTNLREALSTVLDR